MHLRAFWHSLNPAVWQLKAHVFKNVLARERLFDLKIFFSVLQARSAQVPLIMSGKSMSTSSTNYFNVAKALAVNPKEQSGWQQLAQQAKAVSDAMRRLITAIK